MLKSLVVRAAALTAMAVSVAAAQRSESYTLRGERTAVYNVAGKITIERGSGSSVVVEVSRGGNDARDLKIEQRTIDGRDALCIVYPDDKIIYPPHGRWAESNTSVDRDDCRGGSSSVFRGRRIDVSGSGRGVEAWADLHILVPNGRDFQLKHVTGDIDVSDVDGELELDVASSDVQTRKTRGDLRIAGGSGSVTLDGHTGDLRVNVGSGGVRVDHVDGGRVQIGSGSGGVRGTGMSGNDVTIRTGSGGIDLGAVSARRVTMQTGSGGARVGMTSNPEDITVHSGSGPVTLTLPSNFGANVDITTGSGGIDSDFSFTTEGRYRRDRNVHGTIGNGRGRLLVQTGSGGVRLRRSRGSDEDRDRRRDR